MSTTDIKRPNYYEGQYLGASDMLAAQEYQRQQDQRHRLAAHTWGIAAGFELEEVKQSGGSGAVDVFIHPGYAVDGFGRSIVNLQPYKIPPGLLAQFVPKVGTPKQLIPVWLRYREVKTSPAKPGFEICSDEEQMFRITETFRIEVGDLPLNQKLTDLIIAGKPAPANDGKTGELFRSVPYQELPDPDDKARWFILLGFVSWSGTQLVPSDNPGSLSFARPYIGTIAEVVLAPAGRLRIRDRGEPLNLTNETLDLAGVEGSLRVDGDLFIRGQVAIGTPPPIFKEEGLRVNLGMNVDWANVGAGTLSSGIAFGMLSGEGIASKRTPGGNQNGLDLFTKFVPRLSITNDGSVGIGTVTPKSRLQVEGDVTLTGSLGVGTTAPSHKFHVISDERVGLFESTGSQAYLRLITSEGLSKRVELANRPGGRLSLWVNNEDVLNIGQDRRVGIGTTTPSRKLEIVGDLQVTAGNIFVGATRIPVHTPVDVVVGQKFFAGQLIGNGSGFVSVSVVSRLAAASSATVMVALSDISNIKEATNARWKVHTNGVATVGNTGTNATASFDVFWQVDDDGEIHSFQFVVVFQP